MEISEPFPPRQSEPGEIRVDGTTKNTLEYEIVQVVDTGPILRDMAFSVDHEHLYIMSEKQVPKQKKAMRDFGGVMAGALQCNFSGGHQSKCDTFTHTLGFNDSLSKYYPHDLGSSATTLLADHASLPP
ncbi:plexin-A4 [Grus japonensis]|uniref:Plexin-A4 n=1 Tax=Grus japonensis TaxID=30415 RepID=A0ABC9VR22_GRUJA